jgi:hypothetical protein
MKKLSIIFLAFIMLLAASCEDELDLQPSQSLSESEALADLKGLETALLGAYSGLQEVDYYGRELIVIPEVTANLVYLSLNNSNRFVANYNYQWTPNNGDITGMWNVPYNVILRVNNVINNIDGVEGDATLKNQIRGEALAIRALAHFDLVRLFAKQYTNSGANPTSGLGVPIVLEAKIDEPARNTIDEVYNQVIADLNAARAIIGDNGIHRFGPDAVDALLARVYLYKGDNTMAVQKAGAVIGSGNYTLVDDYLSMWDAPGSSEEVFTLKNEASENRGSDNLGGIYNPDTYGDIRVAQDLIDLYEEGDQRAGTIYLFDDGTYYQNKYTIQDGIPGLHSPKLLRLGELHLIRAEANFKLGNPADALTEINALRAARGASQLDAITFDDIISERHRELAFEGHTAFDYWRNNITMVRQQCNTGLEVNSPCEITSDDNLTVHPIPQREMDVNQNMVQNPGYLQ